MIMRMPIRRLAVLAILALCATALVFPAFGQEREPFRLQLKWLPQAQFMGYYVAEAKGLYAREGLDVRLVPGGPGITTLDAIANGSADAAVEWMETAYRARSAALPLINVAQIFESSGLMLVCHRDRGIFEPRDLAGLRVMVPHGGNEVPLIAWLSSLGLSSGAAGADVELVAQGTGVDGYFDGSADCVTATSYNEYWTLLDRGVALEDMTVFRYQEYGFALLKDGLYLDGRRLHDPAFRDRAIRFLRASLAGWRYAVEHPDEAAYIVAHMVPGSDLEHQKRMAREVAHLVGSTSTLGLLELDAYDRTLGLVEGHVVAESGSGRGRFWTHDLWEQAAGGPPGLFTREVRYRLAHVLSSPWFYALDLIGTLAFGIAGFLRAVERRYDFWGAFILTLLPAVGGGTVRDLLIGGERSPPFVFTDPIYIYIVLAIVFIGFPLVRLKRYPDFLARQFGRALFLTDTIGLAAFTIIGASVAIRAELAWFWMPICAALTCAGGGVLLDIVTGREPRTFLGEPYEELAIVGGLLFSLLLVAAGHFEHVTDAIFAAIALTLGFVFLLRSLVVLRGWRIPRLGLRVRGGATATAG